MDVIPMDFIQAQSRTLKSLDQHTQDIVLELLDEFESKFPETYALAMGGAKVLEQSNMEMSNLAADIAFDIYITYRNFYGDRLRPERDRLIPSLAGHLAVSLPRLLLQPRPATQRISEDPSHLPVGDRFQPNLMRHIISEVDHYMSFHDERRRAEGETKAYLMATVYVFNQLIVDPAPM